MVWAEWVVWAEWECKTHYLIMRKRNINKKILIIIKIILITLVTFIITDILFRSIQKKYNSGQNYVIKNKIFHHTLEKNLIINNYFQYKKYKIITNSLGFRDSQVRKVIKQKKNRRIVFIGDSFTEGVGLDYEKTFVGIIDNFFSKKNVEILNAGVQSYSPKIYWRKIKYLIEIEKIYFTDLVVFIDISDIEDEAIYYDVDKNNNVVSIKNEISNFSYKYIRNKIEEKTFFTFKILSFSKQIIFPNKAYDGYKSFKRGRLDNTYSNFGFKESIKYMNKLYDLCKKNNINLTIAIYPWPTQIFEEDLDSKQVKVWENWSKSKNIKLINYFPKIIKKNLSELEKNIIIKKYFFKNDVHFNILGNELISNYFLKEFK